VPLVYSSPCVISYAITTIIIVVTVGQSDCCLIVFSSS